MELLAKESIGVPKIYIPLGGDNFYLPWGLRITFWGRLGRENWGDGN